MKIDWITLLQFLIYGLVWQLITWLKPNNNLLEYVLLLILTHIMQIGRDLQNKEDERK
jgi:hypothetical protein